MIYKIYLSSSYLLSFFKTICHPVRDFDFCLVILSELSFRSSVADNRNFKSEFEYGFTVMHRKIIHVCYDVITFIEGVYFSSPNHSSEITCPVIYLDSSEARKTHAST